MPIDCINVTGAANLAEAAKLIQQKKAEALRRILQETTIEMSLGTYDELMTLAKEATDARALKAKRSASAALGRSRQSNAGVVATEEMKADIRRRLSAGDDPRDIAAAVGVSSQVVHGVKYQMVRAGAL